MHRPHWLWTFFGSYRMTALLPLGNMWPACQFWLSSPPLPQEKRWTRVELEEMAAVLQRGGADFECWYAERYGLTATAAARGIE